MKKIVLVAAALVCAAVTSVEAQKVNTESLLGAIEKSEKDLLNEKKSAKASTWMNAAEAYVEAQTEPVKALYVSMLQNMLEVTCGKAKSSKEVTIEGRTFTELTYPYVLVYLENGQVAAWSQTRQLQKGALDKAVEYYSKAYEIDPSLGDKITEGLKVIDDYYKQVGDMSITLGNYDDGAAAFINAYEIESLPMVNKPDATLVYYAGYMFTIKGSEDPAYFAKGEKYLTMALEAGYQDVEDANKEMADAERGNIYYYIYHCCVGQKDGGEAKMTKAKDALLKGISSYPQNERIFEGLTQLYTAEDGSAGDPSELIDVIEKNLAANPNSVTTWFGRGRVYFALKNYDECIASFKRVVELSPELYDGHYYLGLFYTIQADEASASMDTKSYKNQSDYDADLAAVNAIYAKSIPCYEAALAIKPNDASTLDYLKAICFRLRDEPGMMDKYTKYNELYKQVSGK